MQQYLVKDTKILVEKEVPQILKKLDEEKLRKRCMPKKFDHDLTVSIKEKSKDIKSQNKGSLF